MCYVIENYTQNSTKVRWLTFIKTLFHLRASNNYLNSLQLLQHWEYYSKQFYTYFTPFFPPLALTLSRWSVNLNTNFLKSLEFQLWLSLLTLKNLNYSKSILLSKYFFIKKSVYFISTEKDFLNQSLFFFLNLLLIFWAQVSKSFYPVYRLFWLREVHQFLPFYNLYFFKVYHISKIR